MALSELAQQGLLPGRFRLQLQEAQEARVQALGVDEPQRTFVIGEIIFWIGAPDKTDENGRLLSPTLLPRVGLISSGVLTEPDEITQQKETGRLSIYSTGSQKGGGSASDLDDKTIELDLVAPVEMLSERRLYQLLKRAAEQSDRSAELILKRSAEIGEHLGVLMQFELHGQLRILDGESAQFSGTLRFLQFSENGVIESISLEFQEQLVERIGSGESRADERLAPKVIRVRSMVFVTDPADKSASQSYFQTQLQRANQMWNPGCVHFVAADSEPVVLPNHNVSNKSDNLAAIAASAFLDASGNPVFGASLTEPINIIEVFLVKNPLETVKGGDTIAPGSGQDKIVISDGTRGHLNPQLLAHELGHVLNLLHAGVGVASSGFTTAIPGSSDSIMEQLTDIMHDHLSKNTQENCLASNSPAQLAQPFQECPDVIAAWEVAADGTVTVI